MKIEEKASNLKILITSRFIHPYLGGEEVRVKEFNIGDGIKAEDYYRKRLLNEKGSEDYMFTTIEVVDKILDK